jgi:hypothetical protein
LGTIRNQQRGPFSPLEPSGVTMILPISALRLGVAVVIMGQGTTLTPGICR